MHHAQRPMSSSSLSRAPLVARRLHHAPAAPHVRAPAQRTLLPCSALPEESGASTSEEDVAFERLRNTRARVARGAGAGRTQAKVKVVTPLVDAALDEAPTAAGQAETTALAALTLVFLTILGEGLLVATAGFMSEEQDGWVTANVLPAFAPTLGLFLFGSSAYGACRTSRCLRALTPLPRRLQDGRLCKEADTTAIETGLVKSVVEVLCRGDGGGP